MATQRHSNDDEIPPVPAGGMLAQSIVELLSTTASGLVFWSRQPFEMAVELQLRVRAAALPATAKGNSEPLREGWMLKRGFVVQCQPARRADGTVGFQVSLLFIPVTAPAEKEPKRPRLPTLPGKSAVPRGGRRLFGLN